MGVEYSQVDFNKLIDDLTTCCMGEGFCGGCDKPSCIVGYAQNCAMGCLKGNVTYVADGDKNIPLTDLKLYHEEELAKGIAHTLKMCRSCESNHYDQCIISVIRSCYEIGLFGDVQSYHGSTFKYLQDIEAINPQVAHDVVSAYNEAE